MFAQVEQRFWCRHALAAIIGTMLAMAAAAVLAGGAIQVQIGSAQITAGPAASNIHVGKIRIGGPDGFTDEVTTEQGGQLVWYLPSSAPNGAYQYDVYGASGTTSPGNGQEQGDENVVGYQESGEFTVVNGTIRTGGASEDGHSAIPGNGMLQRLAEAVTNFLIAPARAGGPDFNGSTVIADDLELDHFSPTITFADTDAGDEGWSISGDDAGSGNLFEIEDLGTNNEVFRIDETAPANSVFISSAGNVGLGTASPNGDLHVSAGLTTADLFLSGATINPDFSISSGRWNLNVAGSGLFFTDDLNSNFGAVKFLNNTPTNTLVTTASGNVGINTSAPTRRLHVVEPGGSSDSIPLRLEDPDGNKLRFVLASGSDTWTFDNAGNAFNISKAGSGINELRVFDNGNVTIQGTLNESSSREVKTGIDAVEPSVVLSKLAQLRLAEWSYEKNRGVRHIGPMAEDFHAVFGLGRDATHIAPRDMAGVAMASAQALKSRVDEQKETIRMQQQKLEAQEAELRALRSKVDELDALKAQVARIEAALPDQVAAVE